MKFDNKTVNLKNIRKYYNPLFHNKKSRITPAAIGPDEPMGAKVQGRSKKNIRNVYFLLAQFPSYFCHKLLVRKWKRIVLFGRNYLCFFFFFCAKKVDGFLLAYFVFCLS